MIKQYEKGKAVKLSTNFKSTEFDCHGKGCCKATWIDDDLVDFCQKVRDNFGKSVVINSGYRCTIHNKAVGGAGKSKHVNGMAADIVVKGIDPKEVAKYCESIGVLGIGLYDTFVHIDTRTKKAFWYGHGQEKRTTFGGSPEVEVSVWDWQKAAIKDGFDFPRYGADGKWGSECEAVAKKAICKKRTFSYKYPNLTKIVQTVVGVTADGKFGSDTKEAVKAWQKAKGLKADGEVGINTWKTILGVK